MEWIYMIIGLLLILLILGMVSGCAVVKTDFSNDTRKNATVYYYLPESILNIIGTVKVAVGYNELNKLTTGNIIEQSFLVTTEMIADTKNLLALNYTPNPLMSDDIKYTVNSKGLLETVNITTEDRTADIIAKLAAAPQVILGGYATSSAETTTVKIKEFVAKFAIKASDISMLSKNIVWNLVLYNESGVDEEPKVISASFIISSPDLAQEKSTLSDLVNEDGANQTEGIFTRPIKNISLLIHSATNQTETGNILPINVLVADISKLIVIPVNRTLFVKRTNKIGIQDGVILSNEINKPSSVEGIISIPINIAKSVVAIPAQLIQFRFDNTKRLDAFEQTRLAYEKTIQAGKKYALTKDQEIDQLKLEIDKTSLANSIELQKLKIELQTSLLESEKKQYDAQKLLMEIKKQLAELQEKNKSTSKD